MGEEIDLTLPAKAPDMTQYHEQSMTLAPFALYDLAGLDNDDYENLLNTCNSKYGDHGNSVKRPPQYNFKEKPLKEAFDYHLSLGKSGTFEPVYFLAVTTPMWKTQGVLAVALDDETRQCNVDSCFLTAEESGLAMVNVQIDMLDWSDVKKTAIKP